MLDAGEAPHQITTSKSAPPVGSSSIGRLLTGARGVVRQVWPAYLLASTLILCGIGWGLMDNPQPRAPNYTPTSFNADENAVVWAVQHMTFPTLYPRWLHWGTAFFYQVYGANAAVS